MWEDVVTIRKQIAETSPIKLIDLGDLNGHFTREESCSTAVKLFMAAKLDLEWAFAGNVKAGGFDDDTVVADLMQGQDARIAALERLVGKLTLENEFLKGASRAAAQPRSATTSVIAGPPASPSKKDAG